MIKKSSKIYEKAEFVFTNNTAVPQNLRLFNLQQPVLPTTPTFTESNFAPVFVPALANAMSIVADDSHDRLLYQYITGFSTRLAAISSITHQVVFNRNMSINQNGMVLDEAANTLYSFGNLTNVLSVTSTITGVNVNNVILNHAITGIGSACVIGNNLYLGTFVGIVPNILVLNKNTLAELAWFACSSDYNYINTMKFDGSRYVYWASPSGIGIARIDTLTNTFALILTGAIVPYAGSVGIVGQFIYFMDSVTNTIIKYDTVALTFTVILALPPFSRASSFNYDSVNNLLYFTYNIPAVNSFVSVINTATDVLVYNFAYINAPIPLATYSPKYSTLFKNINPNGIIYPTVYAPSVSITGSIDYSYFVESLFNEPKRVRRIEINANTINQVNQPMQIIVKDSNGQQILFTRLPNTAISVMQFNQTQANVDFKRGLILANGNYINSYILGVGQTVSFIIYYLQFRVLEYLSGKMRKLNFLEKENMSSENDLVKEDSGRGAVFPAVYLMSNPEINNLVIDLKK